MNKNKVKKTKVCSKCKKRKKIGMFVTRKSSKDGHDSCCKKCKSKADKKYRIINEKKFKKRKKEYYKKNRKKIIKKVKKWAKENKKKSQKWRREYYQKNKKYIKKQQKKNQKIWAEKNKNKIKKHNHERYIKNKKKFNLNGKKWKTKHPIIVKRQAKKYKQEHRLQTYENTLRRRSNIKIIDHINKKELLERYEYKCAFYGICPKCYYDKGQLKNNKKSHMAHLLPISKFKKIRRKCPHSWDNVIPMRDKCNISMGNKTPLEFIWGKIKEK
jgi:hypothetical protein